MLDFEDVKKAVKFRRRSRLNFLVNNPGYYDLYLLLI